MKIIGIIYLIGCIVAFLIGLYQMYLDNKQNVNNEDRQYEMISGIVFLSWIYVILTIYNSFFNNKG